MFKMQQSAESDTLELQSQVDLPHHLFIDLLVELLTQLGQATEGSALRDRPVHPGT